MDPSPQEGRSNGAKDTEIPVDFLSGTVAERSLAMFAGR